MTATEQYSGAEVLDAQDLLTIWTALKVFRMAITENQIEGLSEDDRQLGIRIVLRLEGIFRGATLAAERPPQDKVN